MGPTPSTVPEGGPISNNTYLNNRPLHPTKSWKRRQSKLRKRARLTSTSLVTVDSSVESIPLSIIQDEQATLESSGVEEGGPPVQVQITNELAVQAVEEDPFVHMDARLGRTVTFRLEEVVNIDPDNPSNVSPTLPLDTSSSEDSLDDPVLQEAPA